MHPTETPHPSPLPRIIAISGKQFSGKDVLADLLCQMFPGYQKKPIASAIKRRYAAAHDLSLEALETNKATHRPGLIAMGDWGRAQDPNYWLTALLEDAVPSIVSDMRLRHEYHFFRKRGAFCIRLNAERSVRETRGFLVSENDPTECDLDDIRDSDWDCVLENNGSRADFDRLTQDFFRQWSSGDTHF
ncbi:MAG: hypothetical protein K2X01_09780 [Cyanobacteria bacterium]|nr:hypothetical protein [Cyanobacteriota bacterium]